MSLSPVTVTHLSETSDPDSDCIRDEEGGVISNGRNTVGSEGGKEGCVGVNFV